MLHPTRRKNEGKNLGRHLLELSERQRTFSREKRPGKRAARKAARMKRPDSDTQLPNSCLCPLLFLFFYGYRFCREFCTIAVSSLCVWRVRRMFSLPGGVFLPCDHGLDFLHQLTYVMRVQPIKSTKRRKRYGISVVEEVSSTLPARYSLYALQQAFISPQCHFSRFEDVCVFLKRRVPDILSGIAKYGPSIRRTGGSADRKLYE